MRPARIAIVGSGFSGTLVAIHLLRGDAPPGAEVVLFEASGRFATGVAYRTRHPRHLLNVPAGRMSAFDDAPDDFIAFAKQRDATVSGGSFAPRSLYGDYLADRLARAQRMGESRGVALLRIASRITSIGRDGEKGWALATSAGTRFDATHVVLALGNLPRARSVAESAGGFPVRDAWDPRAFEGIEGGLVLLVGTGLTMLDVALALAERAPHARMLAISRRGLSPQAHRDAGGPHASEPPADLRSWPRTALGMLRGLRRAARDAAARGIDWRDVVTSIRADTPALWQALPLRERARFLTHLRPYWDVHRHRSAPETLRAFEQLLASGRIATRAARILSVESAGDGRGATVAIRPRGGKTPEALDVAAIIDCTGPEGDVRHARDPLLDALLANRLVRADPIGLGIEVDDDGAVLGGTGAARSLFAVGPLCRGSTWEMTAVPELRGAAARASRAIGSTLSGV